ncbi:MAG: hypothetical protein HQ592_17120, partial [Planctomycetes bacterium]|nr:hypothetical protein [Planctomycetota bacterium]
MPTSNETAGSKASGSAAALIDALLELVYPPHCIVCGLSLHNYNAPYLCRPCLAELPFVAEPRCPKCGHELGEHTTVNTRCRACEGKS